MPAWLLPIIVSAVFLGFYDIGKKHAVSGNALFPVLFFATCTGSTVFVVYTICTTPEAFCCTTVDFLRILLKSCTVAASWIFGYWALQIMPITIVTPLRSTTPLWTLLGGLLIFAEIPTLTQACGMAIIFAGYFYLSIAGKREGYIWHSKGVILIMLATWLGAASALYDKYLLGRLGMDRTTMQLYFCIDIMVILGIVALVARRRNRTTFQWRWSIPTLGLLLILADWMYFYALSVPEARISIISLIRRCNCIISFGAGACIFHDTNIKRKTLALAIILVGTIILALASMK